MSTMTGKMKILVDNEVRAVSAAAQTVNGTAQAKGTATDLALTVVVGADGASAVGGTIPLAVQGSNSTTSSTFVSVTPDKGTLAAATAAGSQTVHLASLQFAFYRIQVAATGGATADVSAYWNYHPMQDSADASVQ